MQVIQLPPTVTNVGSTVVVAVVYSIAAYSSKWLKDGDQFLPRKFARTVVIGLIVGIVAAQTGQALSIATVPEIASTVGAVHVSELVVNTATARVKNVSIGSGDGGGA